MSASFFSGAHNFSVGEMNVKNVSGDYIDHSTKNVRNTFRGNNTYNTRYDQSYHDSSNHHYGHNYTTTNHNHGPVNNIERVDNANFGTNYGYMNQNTFDGPQQNRRTDHHYNAPTYNYDTHAPGGSVVNGDFHGTQYNGQGFPPPGPQADQYRPSPRQGPPPQYGGQRVGQPARPPPQDDRQYGHGPADSQQRPAPVPVPGDFTASDPAVPQEQYRQQREQQPANGPPSPDFNPWQNQNQHQPPPNAPYPTERTVTAPGRPQPNAERSHPAPAPPPAFPPAGTQQRAPSPPQQPSASSDEAKGVARSSIQKPKKKDSWEGESDLRDGLRKHGISYSDSESSSSIRRRSQGSDNGTPHDDGYGVGSGRQSKEKEMKGKEARKDKEGRKEKEPEGGWKENPLLQPENVTFLSAPPRESLTAYVNPMPPTPTPVPDSLIKRAGSPAPSHKGSFYGQPQPTPSARPVNTPIVLTAGPKPLPHAPAEANAGSRAQGISANPSANASLTNLRSELPAGNVSDHEDRVVDFEGLHGVLDGGEVKKKKKKNPVKKFVKGVFGPSRKKTLD